MESIIPTAEDLFLMIEEVSKPAAQTLHVRFAPDVTVLNKDKNNSSVVQWKTKDSWYTKEEIVAFKLKVQR